MWLRIKNYISDEHNLINIKSLRENLINNLPSANASCANLIDTVDNETILINKSLQAPLLTIADKLLVRQNLNSYHLQNNNCGNSLKKWNLWIPHRWKRHYSWILTQLRWFYS